MYTGRSASLIASKTIKYRRKYLFNYLQISVKYVTYVRFHPTPMGHQPLVGQDLLIVEASRSHSDTPHSVRLFWTSDQSVAETCLPDNTQHSQETDIHIPGGIRTENPNKRAAADPRLHRSSSIHASDRAPTWIVPTLQMVTQMHTACQFTCSATVLLIRISTKLKYPYKFS
jgi:hypothetical protein